MIAMMPQIKQRLKFRFEDKRNDPAEVIQFSAMARGLLKMALKLGILKKKTGKEAG